jgi:hypothetical protein
MTNKRKVSSSSQDGSAAGGMPVAKRPKVSEVGPASPQPKPLAVHEGWCYAFRDSPDPTSLNDTYLFVENLGEGVQCIAQRVWHVETGSLAARKVRTEPLSKAKLENEPWSDVLIPQHLDTFHPPAVTEVHYLSPTSAHEVPISPEGATESVRVSYWRPCNGGPLADCFAAYHDDDRPVPPVLVARCVRQVLETLRFMYAVADPPVVHTDLHSGNVLVDWPEEGGKLPDFYVMDFGFSCRATWQDMGACYRTARDLNSNGFQMLFGEHVSDSDDDAESWIDEEAWPVERIRGVCMMRHWRLLRQGDRCGNIPRRSSWRPARTVSSSRVLGIRPRSSLMRTVSR